MTIFNLSLEQLQRRRSMKWRAHPEEVLPAWVAEMDCLPAPEVASALHELIDIGDTGYPAEKPYEQAYAAFAADSWGWEYDWDNNTIIVPDVMQGCAHVIAAFTDPDAHVVINPPVYPPFFSYPVWAGRQLLHVPMTEGGRLDVPALEKAFAGELGPKPQAYLLSSPHNPHGTVHTAAELAAVAEAAARHDVLVVVDEIHAPFVSATDALGNPTPHVPYLTLPNTEKAVIVTSASKAWNLAGLKAAIAIGGSAVAERLMKFPHEITHSASHLGILSHTVALNESRGWLGEVVAEVEDNRRLLANLLHEKLPQVHYSPGPGTYLAWVDCRELGLSNPWLTFLESGKVRLNDGRTFGPGGEQHVRVNLATSPEIITAVVNRMAGAVG